ncbi:MAG: hypothetical protein NTY16_08325 [Deltaproteobacteria bacterium]|nr:hypothetical protein [Deltaproteobacteria bacterium]
MRNSEADRKQLIKKLKSVKDPRERDRIIWALAGHEQKSPDDTTPAVQPGKTTPGKPMDLRNLPKITIDPKRMLGLVVPGFFTIFGVAYIAQSILNYLATRRIEPEIPRLITGGIFVIIGLAGLLKAIKIKELLNEGKMAPSQRDQTKKDGMASR